MDKNNALINFSKRFKNAFPLLIMLHKALDSEPEKFEAMLSNVVETRVKLGLSLIMDWTSNRVDGTDLRDSLKDATLLSEFLNEWVSLKNDS